jgi:hypothetical protein
MLRDESRGMKKINSLFLRFHFLAFPFATKALSSAVPAGLGGGTDGFTRRQNAWLLSVVSSERRKRSAFRSAATFYGIKHPKLTIGFSGLGMVYAPSAFFGSGFGRINGSTNLTILDIYVTAS